MKKKIVSGVVLLFSISTFLHAAGDDFLLFYASFDKNVNADKATGLKLGVVNPKHNNPNFGNALESQKDPLLKLIPGIKGNGLLTGVDGQVVYYQAKGNINPATWTVSFWVKGIDGKNYLKANNIYHQFFEMAESGGGWTRFYKTLHADGILLLITKKDPREESVIQKLRISPKIDVSKWHFFTITYEKGNGVSIYLNGKLAAQDLGIEPIQKPVWFRVGQSFGSKESNRIIDEFKIYGKALTENEISKQFLDEGSLKTEQRIVVPKTGEKIVIDGKINESEWKSASVISGFINNQKVSAAETQTRTYITYDDSYLYIAFDSDIPQEAKDMPEMRLLHGILKSTKLSHDVDVDNDDSFGIFIIPRETNGIIYRLWVNGIETKYEYTVSPSGLAALKWDPKWDVKSHINMDGWSVELRIPLKDMNIDTIKDGETWNIQFLRKWKQLKDTTDTWAYFSDPKKNSFGTLAFTGNNSVAVKVKEVSGFELGKIKFDVELNNISDRKEAVSVVLKAGKNILKNEKYTIAPNKTLKFQSKVDLTQVKANMLHFDIKNKKGEVYYSQSIPYFIPKKLTITLKKYPAVEQVVASWQIRKIYDKVNDLNASIEIIPVGDSKAVIAKKIQPLASFDGSTAVSTKNLPIGKYQIKMTLRNKNKILVNKLVDYEKKPLPEWFGNRLGISEKVPPPWTALKLKNDAVSMWGRIYDFKGTLFPYEINNQGNEILSAPMDLLCKMADGTTAKSSAAACEIRWDKKTPVKVSSIRTQDLAGIKIINKSYIEFDGMMWMEIEVAPKYAKASVKELTLRIPMKKRYAHLINAYDYSLRKTGKLPNEGYTSSMGPRWVGDEEGGIQVFAETSDNWIGDKRKELEIINGEKEVVFKLRLINKLVTIDKPITFSLGFIVTPVKQTVQNMRDIIVMSGRWIPLIKGTGLAGEYYKKAFQVHKGLEVYHGWSQGWWKTEEGYKGNADQTGFFPIPRENLSKSYGTDKTDYGMTFYSAPYARLQQAWAGSPEFDQFGDEWMSNINKLYINNESVPRAHWSIQACQNARSFQDFTLYGLNKLLDRSTRAFYFDVSKPHACNNIYHGCGSNNKNENPGYTMNILGTRQLVRRIYTLLKEKHPDGMIFFHMSGQLAMPCWSFTDALVDGENFHSLHDRKNNRGMENFLTLDTFAAEYAAQNNFGPYSVILPQFSRSGAIKDDEWKELGYQHAEYLLGLIFLHNSQLWFPAYIPVEPTTKLYYAFDKNGLDSTFKYIAYWKQQVVKIPDNIKASFFVSPNKKKAFMIVMNFSWKDKIIDLKINPAKLEMKTINSAKMIYPEKTVNFVSGTVIEKTTIPGKNFRLYILENTNK